MPAGDRGPVVVLSRGGVELACWPLRGPNPPDLAVVDGLARLQLAAHRLGWSIRVREACPALVELLALAGLDEVVRMEGR